MIFLKRSSKQKSFRVKINFLPTFFNIVLQILVKFFNKYWQLIKFLTKISIISVLY